MANQGKHSPKDTAKRDSGQGKPVIDKQSMPWSGKEAKTDNPAQKRERSEQPPTRHNSKT